MGTALLTDQYELTMLTAAISDGTAERHSVFEVFARSLRGQSFGVVAGLGRVLEAIEAFAFDPDEVDWLLERGIVDAPTAHYLTEFRFRGTIRAIREGSLYLPHVPVLTVEGTFAECVLLETVILSIMNHDTAVATKAALVVEAANGKSLLEMGSRRTHEEAAVAAARAAYIAGFQATSNLAAGWRYGIPTMGTAAHAWTLAHLGQDGEAEGFRTQLRVHGLRTTLLIDTYDIPAGITTAVEVAREFGAAGPGGIRIDSGDLYDESVAARKLLDELGATETRIVVSGDLDEHAINALEERGAPIDGYGVGTKLVSNLEAPGFVYKLVAIADAEGTLCPVEKRAEGKHTVGGLKAVWAVHSADGQLASVHVVPAGCDPEFEPGSISSVVNHEVTFQGLRLCRTGATSARNDRSLARATAPLDTTTIPVIRYGL